MSLPVHFPLPPTAVVARSVFLASWFLFFFTYLHGLVVVSHEGDKGHEGFFYLLTRTTGSHMVSKVLTKRPPTTDFVIIFLYQRGSRERAVYYKQ